MNITQSPQIVDLKEEEPKYQVNMDIMESDINNVEFGKGSKLQSEGSSRTFSSKMHIFDKAIGAAYQSKDDLAKQYAEKGNLDMNEMRELIPEVENVSQHKSFLFIVRDVEKKTFNIVVADEDKVSEIKLKYENISAPEKVKFHRNTSDMLYSYYLGLSLKNSKLSTYAIKLEGQLRQEKTSNRVWKTHVKRMESKGPQGVKSSLEEKDKLIQSLKKKLKMSSIEHPQTT
jgi:vacuolar-type H+-ATPase subunit I/STV1